METKLVNECIICFGEVDPPYTTLFKCSHSSNYHHDCIIKWVQKCEVQGAPPACPVCRDAIVITMDQRLVPVCVCCCSSICSSLWYIIASVMHLI